MPAVKVLCIHGVGHHPNGGAWQDNWERALDLAARRVGQPVELEVAYFLHDHIFEHFNITPQGTLEALAKLAVSGLVHGIGDLLTPRPRALPSPGARAARGLTETVRWTAGMVVQWAENEPLRNALRTALADHIEVLQPDIIFAHSLGSLIAYDTFRHPDHKDRADGRTFVSFGSQIGNPFVRAQFAGRLEPLEGAHWYHLFNIHDDVLTTRVRITDDTFEEVNTTFDADGITDHYAPHYLSHESVSQTVWQDTLSGWRDRNKSRAARRQIRRGGSHERRALIIGINAYDDPEMRLDGCVNDAFLMSEILQENGFESENIRLLLDHRATAVEIWRRLEWLLEGTCDGQQRVLCFSGHGTQLADYGADETIDRVDECLVPYDFDWSRDRAITDDRFHDLYSQLPYGARFTAILDCCHSGGMTRAGGAKPRGLSPPDDIRHRTMKWDAKNGVWVHRRPGNANADLSGNKAVRRIGYFGGNGQRRLMRSTDLLTMDNRTFNSKCDELAHMGPFLPVILQACQEDQLAYEYRHGVTSYGAFTYSLARILRDQEHASADLIRLEQLATHRIKQVADNQVPNFVAPGPRYDSPLFQNQ
ncbi:caspase family protein [Hoeflea prorocentri]|uniref:Caspase family protein n=1 Tax=Hoeflea prorocentri TaxID=1922333 RepID=A0A9X3UGR2_9HYPH|nr:caspase family protein [Hoeflea prorocentri]MCY6381063.1 caspase family protein [Hoeflea prorocentri]MDA5398863.1 caspase family protein [Hoeflea prorocentri]